MKGFKICSTSVVLLVMIFTANVDAAKRISANGILKKVEANLRSKDEILTVDMKIVESNGQSKDRKLEIKKKNGKKQQVLVRLHKPADIKGIGLLSESDGSSENQWLYLPSRKKTRRIASTKRKDRFLDSEFSYEDFAPSTYSSFKNKIIKKARMGKTPVTVIESSADSGPYKKMVTWIDAVKFRVLKTEYYDESGKLLKVMKFNNYQKFGTGWRAKLVKVENMQNKRKTVLKISQLKINSGLKSKEFSKNALEDF